jgi:L-threonylcarbamoyladenylate synthase
MEDMKGKIPLIIDGGMCDVGVESTVLDLCHGDPVVLRPGGITPGMISSVLGRNVQIAGSVLRPLRENETALSPGMRYKHYAPHAVVTLVEGPSERVVPLLRKLSLEQEADGVKSCVLCFTEHVDQLSDCCPHDIGSSSDPSEIAHRLFDVLRKLDEEGMEAVFSEVIPPEGVGLAVMNRLGRAAAFRTIKA